MLLMYMFSAIFLWGRDILCLVQYHPVSGNFLPLYVLNDLKPGYFAGATIPIVVGWALAAELVFYLLSPTILRLKTPAVALLGCISLIINIAFAVLYSHYPQLSAFWMECLLPSNLYFFLLGAVAYRFYIAYWQKKENHPAMLLWGWFILGLFFVILFQIIEDKGSGTSMIQELQKSGIPVIEYGPEGSKEDRIVAQSARIEEGSVFIHRNAAWIDDFRMEVISFPHGRHDDQIDALSQALHWLDTGLSIFDVL